MAITLGNRIKVSTSTTGTGTITLGSAETGYQTFANGGISDGDEVRFVIEDGTAFEISKGTYTHSGTTLSRTLLESTTGALLNLSGDAKVFVTAAADDLMLTGGGTFTGDVTFEGASYNAVWDKSDNALEFADDAKLKFGASDDLEVYHQSSDGRNYIDSGSNELRISATSFVSIKNGFEEMAVFAPNGAVSLYHDNQPKFSTSTTGISVTGNVTVSGTVDGVDIATNIPSSLGSAGQVLTVNAGATAGEWADAAGGGGIGPIDTKVQGTTGNIGSSGVFNFSVSIPSGATIAMMYWNFRGGESNGGSGAIRAVNHAGSTTQLFWGSQASTGSGVVWYNLANGTIYIEGTPIWLGSAAHTGSITIQVQNYTNGRSSRINNFEVYFD